MSFAEARGYLADEDVFRAISRESVSIPMCSSPRSPRGVSAPTCSVIPLIAGCSPPRWRARPRSSLPATTTYWRFKGARPFEFCHRARFRSCSASRQRASSWWLAHDDRRRGQRIGVERWLGEQRSACRGQLVTLWDEGGAVRNFDSATTTAGFRYRSGLRSIQCRH